MVITVLLELRLFELEHELRESLVDDWLVLVVLVEDELGEVGVVVQEIPEGEHDVVAGIDDCHPGGLLVFGLAVLLPVLDELRELALDGTAQIVHRLLLFPLHQHGAKL